MADTCEFGGKARYESERRAKQARNTISRKAGKRNLHVYRCQNCHGYHLTSHRSKWM